MSSTNPEPAESASDPSLPLTSEQITRTLDACRSHLAEISETFRNGLGCDIRLAAGEPRSYEAQTLIGEFQGPGLAISFSVGTQGMLCLIPQTIPLPAWYRRPTISQNKQLQTFAHQLSIQLLPPDLLAAHYAAMPALNLKEVADQVQAGPASLILELSMVQAKGTEGPADGDASVAKLLLIVPVDAPLAPVSNPPDSEEEPTEPEQAVAAEFEESSLAQENAEMPVADEPLVDADFVSDEAVETQVALLTDSAFRALRVLRVPVTVSVRLAERKMPLGQIVVLAPGALVTFNKSCEELLDLFVNNHHYCQGEAVKIGEHFGLKVAKVGMMEVRKEHVL